MLDMDNENVEVPDVLKPDARSSLGTAKTFLAQAVEAMLATGCYEHAKDTIDVLSRVDRLLQDKNLRGQMAQEDSRFTLEEKAMIVANRKIDAIKAVRTRTGYGLREAKDLVESYRG